MDTKPSTRRNSPVIIPPPYQSPTHRATLIFLHGYNDTASAFNHHPPNPLSIAHHLHGSPSLAHLKIVIPEALPSKWPTITMNVWYNIDRPVPLPGKYDTEQWALVTVHSPDRPFEIRNFADLDDIATSLDYLESLIQQEIEGGTPARRIVFLGYSQGASLLLIMLQTRRSAAGLGAVISFAGFAAVSQKTTLVLQAENRLQGNWARGVRLFLLQGKQDVFVPLARFFALVDALKESYGHAMGVGSVETRVIEGLRHRPSALLWPHVVEILEDVVPAEKQSLKL